MLLSCSIRECNVRCLDLTHCLVSVPDPQINPSTNHFQHAGTNISIECWPRTTIHSTILHIASTSHYSNAKQHPMCTCGCCLATKLLNLNVTQSGGGDSGRGSGLLGVTSNMPRTESPFRLMLFHLENVQVTIIAT